MYKENETAQQRMMKPLKRSIYFMVLRWAHWICWYAIVCGIFFLLQKIFCFVHSKVYTPNISFSANQFSDASNEVHNSNVRNNKQTCSGKDINGKKTPLLSFHHRIDGHMKPKVKIYLNKIMQCDAGVHVYVFFPSCMDVKKESDILHNLLLWRFHSMIRSQSVNLIHFDLLFFLMYFNMQFK